MGTLSFRARKGGNYARTCRHARAPPLAAAAGLGLGLGFGLGSGLSLGSLPGLVLFESGLKGMGRTRSDPLRIQTARPPTGVCERIRTARQRLSENRLCGWTVVRFGQLNGCDSSVRTVATVEFLADENALPERYK